MSEDAELLAVFKAEVGEQLDKLEEHLARPPKTWNAGELFHLAHNIKGAARMTATPGLMEAGHALEDLLDALRRGRPVTQATTRLVREGVAQLRLCFEALGRGATPDVSGYVERVAKSLGTDGSPSEEIGGPVADPSEVPHEKVGSPVYEAKRDVGAPEAEATIRIAIDKLDVLMGLSAELLTGVQRAEAQRDAAGKLVTLAERLRRGTPTLQKNPDFVALLATARELMRQYQEEGARGDQISKQLQDAIRMLRMVRTDTLHGVLNRVVRGAAEAERKEIRFAMVGGETEIDRAVLDKLRDPLIHLVRNAVAHGIEPAAERRARNKPLVGAVELRAEAAGSWVEIVIADDGRGIDLHRVKQRAIGLGIIEEREAAGMSSDAVMDLVFQPGLSTAAAVSDLAGRGFGMDVVRANLIEVGGSVAISSAPGRGTEVRLRAPLTRLTTRGLMILLAGQPMAVPMMNVERTLLVDRSSVRTVEGGEVISIEGDLVPIAALSAVLGIERPPAERAPVILLSEGHRRGAFIVDEVIGERELTMQPLGWNLHHVPGVSGGAVLETGEVLLVLDTHELLGAPATRSLGVGGETKSHEARRARVLVVDDSVTSRTLEKNILTSAGYEVLMATNGEAALEVLREEEVDLVITDVDMPKMNGIELVTRIRASAEHARLPTILVTSLGGEEDRRRGAVAGADAYIVKGEFDQDELLRAVSRLV